MFVLPFPFFDNNKHNNYNKTSQILQQIALWLIGDIISAMKQPVHKKILSPARLVRSFKYAFNGLKILIKEEQNYVVHLTTAAAVITLGLYYRILAIEWIVLVLAIQVVLTLETINTAIENLADFVSTERNEKIMRIKDLAAAGVLIAALTAMVIGLIIFLPKMFKL